MTSVTLKLMKDTTNAASVLRRLKRGQCDSDSEDEDESESDEDDDSAEEDSDNDYNGEVWTGSSVTH